MKRAFREAYNRELALLKERAAEFAQEYPGLADRLGGLVEENLDPTVAGLLEGSAFLAARVQTKMQEEFRTFTHELLDQVFPDALAPTPSAMLVQANLPLENTDLSKGVRFAAGDYMDARFKDADKQVSCRFALAAPLRLWPLQITELKYHSGEGPIGALGQEIAQGTKAGIVVTINRIGPAKATAADLALSGLDGLDALDVHLSGPIKDATALFEQIFCDTTRISLRWLDAQGDAVFATLPMDALEQVGFGRDERLFAHNTRLFEGFAFLREFFVFPRKFAGFRLNGLAQYLSGIKASEVQVVFELDTVNRGLASRLDKEHLALNAAPAVNLFQEMSSQVRMNTKAHDVIVTPNSTPVTHYEVQSINEVWAFYKGQQAKVRVHPLYALPPDAIDPRQVLYYTYRRRPRRLTASERRYGASNYRYRGTETFISLYAPPDDDEVQRLQVNTLSSNRHLPEYLPIAQSRDDFYFCDDQTVTLACIAGPTAPTDSLADLETGAAHRTTAGDVYWRLVSYLSLNHFGLESRDGTDAAASLREMLSLFTDLSDNVSEAQVAGLARVETRPVARTVAHADGYHTARGIEVTLTFDEEEYEGSGMILLAAVLDRFLSEYAAINSFTQTVVRTLQRGEIKIFPSRSGSGPLL
ncbi:Type VI secretion protein, family [Sulfitobacter noctilucae]|uniref:type VI secretion system baseplate subunit TssF n=1 Tax=Sulfitobacter noctilucae TaxID=1342302 RepID=UPI000469D25B|nr:type VI secretion system baseplate subunit TssF [Sulfitobacter noctilucae]KIN75127.1 Type VI secretion protein, family [Sulfitobacter noctilucae]